MIAFKYKLVVSYLVLIVNINGESQKDSNFDVDYNY